MKEQFTRKCRNNRELKERRRQALIQWRNEIDRRIVEIELQIRRLQEAEA